METCLSAKEARCLLGLTQDEWVCLIETGKVPSKEVAGLTFYCEEALDYFSRNNPLTLMVAIHDAKLEKSYYRLSERERGTAWLALHIVSLHKTDKHHAA
ncbi:hypothetical protein [Solemya velesiana gill symbiont]|nr:hypothetical protein [Solemya velesiana gill symbiont]